MSATTIDRAIEGCRPTDGTPVTIRVEDLESTAPGHLRRVARGLDERGYVPAEIAGRVSFPADCSLATQAAADRVREWVRAAGTVGANRVRVAVDEVAAPGKARTALSACAERAEREGIALEVEGFALDPER